MRVSSETSPFPSGRGNPGRGSCESGPGSSLGPADPGAFRPVGSAREGGRLAVLAVRVPIRLGIDSARPVAGGGAAKVVPFARNSPEGATGSGPGSTGRCCQPGTPSMSGSTPLQPPWRPGSPPANVADTGGERGDAIWQRATLGASVVRGLPRSHEVEHLAQGGRLRAVELGELAAFAHHRRESAVLEIEEAGDAAAGGRDLDHFAHLPAALRAPEVLKMPPSAAPT